MGIAGILVDDPHQRADDRVGSRALGHGVRRQRNVRRRVVHVRHVDRECSIVEQPAGVGNPHGDGVARRALEVEQRPVSDLERVADDLEPAAGIVCQTVGVGVAGIRVDGIQQGADDRPDGRVLRHRARRQGEVGWRFVGIGDVDGQGLVVSQPASVGDPYADDVARSALEVEQRAVQDLEVVTDELEPSASVVEKAECMSVAGIRVDHAQQRADNCTAGRPFGHVARRQRDIRRRLVAIADDERENAVEEQAAGVGGTQNDVVAWRAFEVEQGTVRDLKLVTNDLEPAARVVD